MDRNAAKGFSCGVIPLSCRHLGLRRNDVLVTAMEVRQRVGDQGYLEGFIVFCTEAG